MKEKLILEIQSTLKSLIYNNRKVRENLIWTLNMQVEDFINNFAPTGTKNYLYEILKKLDIEISYVYTKDIREEPNFPSCIYKKDDKNILFRRKLGTYFNYNDMAFSKKYKQNIDIADLVPISSRLYVFACAIGYYILHYGSTEHIFYSIYDIDMFYSTKTEKVIDLFARALLMPISYVFKNLVCLREFYIEKHYNGNLVPELHLSFVDDEPSGRVLSTIRLQEVRELMADLSFSHPEIYEDFKQRYPSLFSDI